MREIPKYIYYYSSGSYVFKTIKFLFRTKEELENFISNLLVNLPWKNDKSKHYFNVFLTKKKQQELLNDLVTYQTIDTDKCKVWKKLFPAPFYNREKFTNE